MGFDLFSKTTVPGPGQVRSSVIGTAAAQLTGASSTDLFVGVTVKSDIKNNRAIYLGFSKGVNASKGYKLNGGEEVFITIAKATNIWIVGAVDGLEYTWLGQ